MIESEDDTSESIQKIIPDGYPEMIFHYGDNFEANITGTWHQQGQYLIAGQIKNHFFLKNTGVTGIFAIKFQPTALAALFGMNMSDITDQVIPFNQGLLSILQDVKNTAIADFTFEEKIKEITKWFLNYSSNLDLTAASRSERAVQLIIEGRGGMTVQTLQSHLNISQRSLERHFKKHVGLTPKFYSRIIRFSHIFNLISEEHKDWISISYLAGYFDQSHFIKNFKEFTGEEPSKYGFNEQNLANFFLR